MDGSQSVLLQPPVSQAPAAMASGPRSPLVRPRANSAPSGLFVDVYSPSPQSQASRSSSRAGSDASHRAPTRTPVGAAMPSRPNSRREGHGESRTPSPVESDVEIAFRIASLEQHASEVADDPVAYRRALFGLGATCLDLDQRSRGQRAWRAAAAIPRADGDLRFIEELRHDGQHPMARGIIDTLEHLCRAAPIGLVASPQQVDTQLHLLAFRVAEQLRSDCQNEKFDFFRGKNLTFASVQRRDMFFHRIPAIANLYCRSIRQLPDSAMVLLRYCRFADDFFPLMLSAYKPPLQPDACFSAAEALGCGTADEHADYGCLLATRGRLREAASALRRALELSCGHATAIHEILANVEADIARQEAALAPVEQVLLSRASQAAMRHRRSRQRASLRLSCTRDEGHSPRSARSHHTPLYSPT